MQSNVVKAFRQRLKHLGCTEIEINNYSDSVIGLKENEYILRCFKPDGFFICVKLNESDFDSFSL